MIGNQSSKAARILKRTRPVSSKPPLSVNKSPINIDLDWKVPHAMQVTNFDKDDYD